MSQQPKPVYDDRENEMEVRAGFSDFNSEQRVLERDDKNETELK